jgi:hypothetical protein
VTFSSLKRRLRAKAKDGFDSPCTMCLEQFELRVVHYSIDNLETGEDLSVRVSAFKWPKRDYSVRIEVLM